MNVPFPFLMYLITQIQNTITIVVIVPFADVYNTLNITNLQINRFIIYKINKISTAEINKTKKLESKTHTAQ